MEIGQQIIRYRKQQALSQEKLAEKVYVSRQSISNWENDKTYPDIHSLLLLSQIFQVSLDQLIKGDIEKMKYIITQVDKKNFKRDTKVMVTLMILLMISSYPLVYFLEWLGLGIFVLLSIITMTYANRVERFKKKYDVQPYKEILAVSNGKLLDEIEKREERAKLPYQKPLIVTVFFLITVAFAFAFAFAFASRFMFTWLFH
ncbi:XRE family transcriptional regulator [Streptococcus pyogenes]|uniref:helix-turn-helix domain-containing protein n=1 Tax=Streptococcus pyogenes TaxID=1314 RepID=UPI00109C0346|nr:helix-turn-helix transcriptional regulator [Streptococcus pyogenes]QCK73093.1 XRE family transcriptional regulator [Streptococcus pyogenes]VHG91308.1 transcriptional regulator [Streptococcus pyogenes]VHM41720.1 transcriptional regulator [Streptococcus pyogenes]